MPRSRPQCPAPGSPLLAPQTRAAANRQNHGLVRSGGGTERARSRLTRRSLRSTTETPRESFPGSDRPAATLLSLPQTTGGWPKPDQPADSKSRSTARVAPWTRRIPGTRVSVEGNGSASIQASEPARRKDTHHTCQDRKALHTNGRTTTD